MAARGAYKPNSLKPLIDTWPEVQRILGLRRMQAAVCVENMVKIERMTLYVEDDTGLFFPRTFSEPVFDKVIDMGCSNYAHGDDDASAEDWYHLRIAPDDFEKIIRQAEAVRSAGGIEGQPVENGPDTRPPARPAAYSTFWLSILHSAVTEFFEPRRERDAKKDEVVDWIMKQATDVGITDSRNVAEAIFTIIKPADHNPRKPRNEEKG